LLLQQPDLQQQGMQWRLLPPGQACAAPNTQQLSLMAGGMLLPVLQLPPSSETGGPLQPLLCIKRTYQPHVRRYKRKHGFLKRCVCVCVVLQKGRAIFVHPNSSNSGGKAYAMRFLCRATARRGVQQSNGPARAEGCVLRGRVDCRMSTADGRKIIARRKAKGRWRLAG
jgi:ribosomal protein L34